VWSTILANGVDILGVPVNWNTDLPTSIADVAAQINSNSATYTAVASGAILYISKLATSSADLAITLAATGTAIDWTAYNVGGGTTGVNGGVFPGVLNVTPNDLAVRFNQQGGEWLTSPASVTVETGLPPFTYAWELASGEASKSMFVSGYGTLTQIQYPESPNAPSTRFRVTNTSTTIMALANTTKWRCRVTDSLSRVGYSPSVTVHSP
jgi:hypothetical protein